MSDTIYDSDGKIKELEDSFAGKSATESGSQKSAANDGLESAYASPSATESGSQKLADAGKLKEEEESPPDRSGFSAGDDMREKLGQGYTGKGSTKSKGLSKLYSGDSKFKKKVALAGAAAGGSLIGGILIFLALLPLKIEHLVANVEGKFAATSQQALAKETDNLFNTYMTKHVMPYLNKGTCRTTISPGCAHVGPGTTPVGKLFGAWKDGRIEQKLATQYGLVFGREGTNRFYMISNGQRFNIHADNIFASTDGKPTTRNEIRQAVRKGLKDATLFDKVYFRFKVGKLLERKYGIKRCIIACKTKDKFTDSIADKKLAGKALIARRVIGPLSESYGMIAECVFAGAGFCSNTFDKSTDGKEPTTAFDRELQTRLDAFAAKYGTDALKDLVKASTDIGDKGISKFLAKKLAAKVSTAVGVNISEGAAEKAVPVVGWALLIGTLLDVGSKLGDTVRYGAYAANSTAAVQTYQTYRTVADELHTGNVDPTELGSLTTVLSTNVSGSKDNRSDMTQTPLYQNMFGSKTTTSGSIFGSLLGTSASADSTSSASKADPCNDGKPIPAGKLVCSEEKLDAGSDFANQAQSFVSTITNLPGVSIVLTVINKINSAIGSVFSAAFKGACNVVDLAPPFNLCTDGLNKLGSYAAEFMNFIISKMVVSPFSGDMTGGRTGNMVVAGGDAALNQSCKVELGCAAQSTLAITNIRNQQIADDKANFNSQPMFARMFDTTSSYSLVTRLAMSMPSSGTALASGSLGSLLSNPFGKLTTGISSAFSSTRAFAQTAPQDDAFGIPQSAITDAQIDSIGDSDTYWQTNCADPSDPLMLSTDKMNAWYNDPANVVQDKNTGETKYLNPNYCLLIQGTVQSAGGTSDPSLLPQDSTNSSGDAPSSTPSGDISAYKNPFRDVKGLAPNRVDQGVDYGSLAVSPVYAIGNGVVMHTADGGWPGGWFNVYKLTDGPAAGKFVFVAEECPAAVKIGQKVTSGTVICNMAAGSYTIEMGWAADPSQGGGLALAHSEYTEGLATSYGQNFSKLLQKLGAAPGILSGPGGATSISKTPLPTGWPTW